MPFTGSCRCAAIRSTADEDAPIEALHPFTTPDRVKLDGGRDGTATYRLNHRAVAQGASR